MTGVVAAIADRPVEARSLSVPEPETAISIARDRIRLDGGTQPRAEIDRDYVSELAADLQRGVSLPPVTVFFDGENYWLADGFHRWHAHQEAGYTKLSCQVRQGTRRDAVLYSVGVNAEHGKRRSDADKRRQIETLLNDPEWTQWSDREIAKRCKVSPTTVGKIRASLSVHHGQIQTLTKEKKRKANRDGKVYEVRTDNIGKRTALRKEIEERKREREKEDAATAREHELNLRQALPLEQLQQMSREQLQEELIALNQEESDRAELLSGDSLVQTTARLTAKKRLLLELIEAQSNPDDATNRDFSEIFNQLNEVGLVEPSNNIHIIWISVDRYFPLHWLKANGCEERNRRVLGDRSDRAFASNQFEVEAKIVAAIQEDCDRLNWPYRLQRMACRDLSESGKRHALQRFDFDAIAALEREALIYALGGREFDQFSLVTDEADQGLELLDDLKAQVQGLETLKVDAESLKGRGLEESVN